MPIGLRKIPIDEAFRINLDSLSEQIEADRTAGDRPFCVIGTAGTVNTAAVDDLAGLAEIFTNEKLWFHVDGAFGSLAIMSNELKPKLRGIERADSIAFDLHKWMHVPYDAGCILIRDSDLHRASFSMRPVYLSQLPRHAGGQDWPCEFGLELSRGFRALKIWFALKEHGSLQFGQLISQNCAQARYLAEAVACEAKLELLAPVSLNIVCFRYRASQMEEAELDTLNEGIVEDIQEAEIAAPSTTGCAVGCRSVSISQTIAPVGRIWIYCCAA